VGGMDGERDGHMETEMGGLNAGERQRGGRRRGRSRLEAAPGWRVRGHGAVAMWRRDGTGVGAWAIRGGAGTAKAV
jgi:hypothetical protein